nr:hypothetical protein [Ardenticatenales bacterium]
MMMGNQRPGGGGPMGGPMGGMMGGAAKARNFKDTMRKLVDYLRPYQLSIIIVIIFAIASTLFMIVGPKILGNATTKLFEGVMAQIAGTGSIDFDYIGRIILTMLGLYLFSNIMAYIQGWIMAGVSMEVTYKFRQEISEKINRMPLQYFDGTNQGEVLSRVTNDVDTISQTLNQSLSQIITSVVTLVGVLVMMFSISESFAEIGIGLGCEKKGLKKINRGCRTPHKGALWLRAVPQNRS